MSKSSSPLHGKRVLITRPAHQSREFAEALRRVGAEPVLAPTIEIAPPDDLAAAERAVNSAPSYAWIVFSSANGVRAFFDILDARREDARFLGASKIAAIGIVTAKALRERAIYPDLVPQSFVAESLADSLVTATQEGDRILVFRAQEARDVLQQRLRDAKRAPVVVAAYKTVFLDDPDFASKVAQSDILTFTSASTVRGFSYNLAGDTAAAHAAAAKIVACIGPVTAQAAHEIGMRVDVVADQFTSRGLLRSLERLLAAA